MPDRSMCTRLTPPCPNCVRVRGTVSTSYVASGDGVRHWAHFGQMQQPPSRGAAASRRGERITSSSCLVSQRRFGRTD
jgi:hypothetical protein